MGIPAEMYCKLAECDEVIGAVTAAAAQQTGLEKGTPVVAGGEDKFGCTGHRCYAS